MSEASSITDISYDGGRQLLRLTFVGGTLLTFAGVPSSIHAGLMAATSRGVFYADHIRDRYQRI